MFSNLERFNAIVYSGTGGTTIKNPKKLLNNGLGFFTFNTILKKEDKF